MSRTIGFTMDEAATEATSSFDDQLKVKVGGFQNTFKRLLEDDSIDDPMLLIVVDQLRTVLASRQQLQQLLTGQAVTAPAALGGGSSGTSPDVARLQQELQDAQDELQDKEQERQQAVAQNRTLQQDRDQLVRICSDLGITVPPNTNTPFPSDTRQRVKDAIDDKVNDEVNRAMSSANLVDKAEVKDLADEALTAVNNVKGRAGTKPTGLDDAKSKVKEVVDKVS